MKSDKQLLTGMDHVVLICAVQHECIPQAVLGMDIICQAKSGMGKTAVFVLATLHQVQSRYFVVLFGWWTATHEIVVVLCRRSSQWTDRSVLW